MNYELFIAKRIIAGKEYKNSISSPIIKIAVTAIALGITIMLISVSIASGFQQKILDKMAGFKGHIQITNYDANNSEISTVSIDKNQEFYPVFKTIDGIKKVQVYANKAGIIRTQESFEGIVLKGVSKEYDFSFFKEYLIDGRIPNYAQERNREILVSKSISDRLHLKIGDTLQALFRAANTKMGFKSRKPIVSGIYKTGFEQFDKSIVLGDIREVQRLNKWTENQIGGFEVVLKNFNELRQKGNEVYSKIGSTLNATTITDLYPAIFEWVKLFDNNVWFIIAIMILVAGINMIIALLVLILERVQMVGILKALGSNNNSIRKIFLYNASYLILKGLFYGNLIGLSLLFTQKYFKVIQLNPETYHVSTVPVSINLGAILLLNLGTLILCVSMLFISSTIITKIDPSKAIKFS